MPRADENQAVLPPALRAADEAMHRRFREVYRQRARFREDAQLAEALADEAAPVLEVMAEAFAAGDSPPLHEAYALLTLLARETAALGATPGVAMVVVDALVAALAATGVTLDSDRIDDLRVVAVEGYCAARDERASRLLRERAAESQVAVELAPGCVGIFLAGTHDEADLTPTLDRFARDLLHANTLSVLLDVSRLAPIDEDLGRVLGRFCAQAATLGVCSFVVGAPSALSEWFTRWSVSGGPTLLVDDLTRARNMALAAAGCELRPARRWSRWFLPARRALVR